MTIKRAQLGTLALVLTCGLTACATGNNAPSTTPDVKRQLTSIEAGPNLETYQDQAQQLPESISVEDAKRLLVTIDPAKIDSKAKYSLNWWRGFGLGWPYGINRLAALSYYPYGSYYYPYSLYGNSYYPYSYGGYSPFLYGGYGLYSPFYGGLGLFGSSFFGRGFGHGFHGHGGHGGHHR